MHTHTEHCELHIMWILGLLTDTTQELRTVPGTQELLNWYWLSGGKCFKYRQQQIQNALRQDVPRNNKAIMAGGQ